MTPRELMTDYLAAAKRGDWETAFGFLADDLLIHIPGRSAFADQRSASCCSCASAFTRGCSSPARSRLLVCEVLTPGGASVQLRSAQDPDHEWMLQ